MTGLDVFATALGATFIAELGDKTQLAVLFLAQQHRAWPLFFAASLAMTASVVLAASLGAAAGFAIGGPWLTLLAGLIFLVFGTLGLIEFWRHRSQPSEEVASPPSTRNLIAVVFAVVFVAELGDKTQIATALFASQGEPLWAAFGSLMALVLSTGMAVVLGGLLARMSERAKSTVRLIGALTFCAVGTYQVVVGLDTLLGP